MKRVTVISILLAALMLVLIVAPVVANARLSMSYNLEGKVKRLELPMASSKTKPAAAVRVKANIVFPEDGAELTQGTYNVLVTASSKAGIAKVELEISGAGSIAWTDITASFDGTYYTYEWEVSTDGAASLSARVTDNAGKTTTVTNTIYIGEPQPEKWAVLIGIADYSGRGNDLWHPDEDAKDMLSVLTANGYASDHVKVLLNRQATALAITNAIDWLVANENAGDEVVFFYSGHGFNVTDSSNWDSDIETDGIDECIVSYDLYGISDGWLKQRFSNVESTKFALMFGSCFSGGMFDDNDDLQGEGRIIASACKADQLGWDYLTLGNTLWGYYFVDQGLLQGNANSVEAAHAYCCGPVTAVQSDSEPQMYDNFAGEFIL
jgi:hypothetical protein